MTGRRITDNQIQSDHDLLISFRAETNTKLDRVVTDVAGLTSSINNDLAHLRIAKLDKDEFYKWQQEEFAPVKIDVEGMKKYVWMGMGVLAFLQVASLVIGIYAALRH